jgi:hypothetical protein
MTMSLMMALPALAPLQVSSPHGGMSNQLMVCASCPQYVIRIAMPDDIARANFCT